MTRQQGEIQMANNSEARGNDRNVPADSTAQSSNQGSSNVGNTQMKTGDKSGPDGGAKGRPDQGGNRSGGQGNLSQQSNVDADRGGPSRQTSEAQDEEGQAS
jgi:hypothetical protein